MEVEKCKGHADDTHVASGETTEEARHGNNRADRCAEKGCARHHDAAAWRSRAAARGIWQQRLLRSRAAVLTARTARSKALKQKEFDINKKDNILKWIAMVNDQRNKHPY